MQIKKLMNIPKNYKIKKTELIDEEIHVWLEPYKRLKAHCSKCGKIHEQGFHGTTETIARDLPITGRAVYLHVLKRRYLCPSDGKVHNEYIEWLKKKQIYQKICF